MFWIGVEKGSVRVRTPPFLFTTDCSFTLYPKMNLICSTAQHSSMALLILMVLRWTQASADEKQCNP